MDGAISSIKTSYLKFQVITITCVCGISKPQTQTSIHRVEDVAFFNDGLIAHLKM